MEVEILEKEKDSRLLGITGEDHTLANLLRIKLNEEKDVAASYTMDHPLLGKIKFYVRSEERNPDKVVMEACDKIVMEIEEFRDNFEKALKKK
ncbi:MAG: DNA-directed RNA polymerase subunit L [Candidatus Hadarchaeales archaeon]